jgi:hypothetical protein
MAYTLTQLDLLNAAIAQGALSVEYADKKVTYRSLAEMYAIKNEMMLELGIKKPDSGRRYADYRSGL